MYLYCVCTNKDCHTDWGMDPPSLSHPLKYRRSAHDMAALGDMPRPFDAAFSNSTVLNGNGRAFLPSFSSILTTVTAPASLTSCSNTRATCPRQTRATWATSRRTQPIAHDTLRDQRLCHAPSPVSQQCQVWRRHIPGPKSLRAQNS